MLAPDLRTLYPYVRELLRPPGPSPAVHWELTLDDADVGSVRLTGRLREELGARELAILVHGLGGSAESLSCRAGARALAAQGVSTLRLALRGADRRGEDVYNIAQVADLCAVLASPEVARYDRVYVIGYSMGGYIALHTARACDDPRLAAVAAVCAPLDLPAALRHIDSPRASFYRRYVLGHLIEMYSEVAQRGVVVPTDPERVRRARTLYEWDELVIAPRYGFDSPEAYYEAVSIVPHLERLRVPALLVSARHDPVVSTDSVHPFEPTRSPSAPPGEHGISLRVHHVERAGHLAFRSRFDLGFEGELGLEAQLCQWMRIADRGESRFPSAAVARP